MKPIDLKVICLPFLLLILTGCATPTAMKSYEGAKKTLREVSILTVNDRSWNHLEILSFDGQSLEIPGPDPTNSSFWEFLKENIKRDFSTGDRYYSVEMLPGEHVVFLEYTFYASKNHVRGRIEFVAQAGKNYTARFDNHCFRWQVVENISGQVISENRMHDPVYVWSPMLGGRIRDMIPNICEEQSTQIGPPKTITEESTDWEF